MKVKCIDYMVSRLRLMYKVRLIQIQIMKLKTI